MNSYVDATRMAIVASRARHTIAPTPADFRGGAVSIDGFTLASGSAPTWTGMI